MFDKQNRRQYQGLQTPALRLSGVVAGERRGPTKSSAGHKERVKKSSHCV